MSSRGLTSSITRDIAITSFFFFPAAYALAAAAAALAASASSPLSSPNKSSISSSYLVETSSLTFYSGLVLGSESFNDFEASLIFPKCLTNLGLAEIFWNQAVKFGNPLRNVLSRTI